MTRRVLILLAATFLVAGCRVDAHVEVVLRDDGSGDVGLTIVLDADAVARVERNGRSLEDDVRLGDLADAGWNVTPWARADDGGATLRLEKPFVGEAELNDVLAEIAPADVLGDAQLTRERSFLRVRDRVAVRADLDALRTGITEDAELAGALSSFGLDPVALQAELESELDEALTVRLSVEAPGRARDSGVLRRDEVVVVTATRSEFDSGRVAMALAAVALAVLGLALLVAGRRANHRRLRNQTGG